MNLFAVFALTAAIANLSLAVFVFCKGPKRRVNRAFALMSFVLAVYNIEAFGLHAGPDEEFVLTWMKFFRWGVLYAPAAVFYFFLVFVEDKKLLNKIILAISIFASTLPLIGTYIFGVKLKKFIGGYFPYQDPLYDIFLITTISILPYGLWLVFQKYRKTELGIKQTQMKYFFIAVTIGIVIAPVNFCVSYGINIPPFGQLGIVAYTFILAYTIVKYKLMDIETFIHKTIAYVSLSFLVLICYAGALFLIQKTLLHEIIDLANPLYEGILLLTFLFIFAPLKDKSQELVDKIFYKERYDYLDVLENFTARLATLIDLNNLLSLIVNTIINTIHIDKVSIMLLDEDKNVYVVNESKGLTNTDIKLPRNDMFISWLESHGEVIEREQLYVDPQYNEIKDLALVRFKELEAEICIPLMIEHRMIGLLNLNKKLGGNGYKRKEIELLTTLGTSASISINNAKMHKLAITDGLTKLYNHGYFEEYLDNQLKIAKRYDTKLSLVMLDIDHFKQINDTYGHQQGDLILKELANILQRNIRAGDLAVRYGGEEFVLLFPNADKQQALKIIERIRNIVNNYKFQGIKEDELHVTISAGVSEVRQETKNKEELIREADEALYKAKECGRNRSFLYTD
jgi:diguanylate cyclase (GGDEF)-like protein